MKSLALVMGGLVGGACWLAPPVISKATSTVQSPVDARTALAVVAERADVAYRARDWNSALPLYRELTHQQPEGYINWLRLGVCLHGVGENTQALAAYQRAGTNGAPPADVQYQVALVLAAVGDKEKALAALADAVKQGHGRPDLMTSEADFASLRGDPRFDGLLRQAENNQTPCDHRAESRQFDFWVGDWSVVSTKELTPVGRSHIERTIGNCVIWENWTSLGDAGYSGKSYNIFNAELNRWEQFWVDNQGEVIHFLGNLSEGIMDFRTEIIPGKALVRHLRFYNLGADRVRQLSERSEDGGKTWTVEYDFTYSRVH